MVINGTDHTLNKVTVYSSIIIIYDVAGTVTMDLIKVAEFSLAPLAPPLYPPLPSPRIPH